MSMLRGRTKEFRQLTAENFKTLSAKCLEFVLQAAPFDETGNIIEKSLDTLRGETDIKKLRKETTALIGLTDFCVQNAVQTESGNFTLDPALKIEFLKLLNTALRQEESPRPKK